MLDWKATQDEILVESLQALLKDYDASVIIGADLVMKLKYICASAALILETGLRYIDCSLSRRDTQNCPL